MQNLVLFTGENDYELKKRLKFFKEIFAKKYPQGEITILEKENSYKDLEIAVFTPNLFGGKRLTICQDFWDSAKFELAEKNNFFEKLAECSESGSLFVVEANLDKRLKLSKFLLKTAKLELFEKPTNNELWNWIEKTTQDLGGQISRENSKFLLNRCGDNLWNLENEIKKLVSLEKNEISKKLIKEVTLPNPQIEIWGFLSSLSQKKSFEAIKKFRDLLAAGTPVQQVLAMIQREIRIHAQLKTCLNKKLSQSAIIKELKIAPFVVSKTLPLSKNFSISEIEKMYDALFLIDQKVKTGGFYLTTTDTSELELAIEKFIITFCRKT